MKQMDATGPIFAFEVEGRAQAHGLLDALTLIDISNNSGDARSLMTHPASTTHAGVSEDVRHDMGVSEGMLRLNVGQIGTESRRERGCQYVSISGVPVSVKNEQQIQQPNASLTGYTADRKDIF